MSGVKDPRLDRRLTEQINFTSTRTQTLLTTVSVNYCNCNNHANKWEISGNLPPCCGLWYCSAVLHHLWVMRKDVTHLSKKKICQHVWVEKNKTKRRHKKKRLNTGGTDQNWSIIVHFCSTCAVPLSVFVCSLRRRGDFIPAVILASKVRLHRLLSVYRRGALTHNQTWFISVYPDRFVFDNTATASNGCFRCHF